LNHPQQEVRETQEQLESLRTLQVYPPSSFASFVFTSDLKKYIFFDKSQSLQDEDGGDRASRAALVLETLQQEVRLNAESRKYKALCASAERAKVLISMCLNCMFHNILNKETSYIALL
jgi:hypothetical protein